LKTIPAEVEPTSSGFTCPTQTTKPHTPTSVHNVRLVDIAMVAALGDSLTAAFGAEASSVFSLFNDYRGVSWAAGGKDDVSSNLVFGNILRAYNPNVVGYSIGKGDANSANAKFNTAVTGAVSSELIEQIDILHSKLTRENPSLVNTYKMITLMIGCNNLCDLKDNPTANGVDAYRADLIHALDYLKSKFKNVIVNLVTPPDVGELADLSSGFCSLLHGFECPSAVKEFYDQLTAVQIGYNNVTKEMEQRYIGDDSFVVVQQPFLLMTHMPKKSDGSPDMSYVAPDCFHLSAKGQRAAAVGLYNNVVEEIGQKLERWIPHEPIECADPDAFIPTPGNSGKKVF